MLTHYEKNKERYKANAKRWYSANKQQKILKGREWEKRNPEKVREYIRKAMEKAKGKDRTKYRETMKLARIRWRENNPEKWRKIQRANKLVQRHRRNGLEKIDIKAWEEKVQ